MPYLLNPLRLPCLIIALLFLVTAPAGGGSGTEPEAATGLAQEPGQLVLGQLVVGANLRDLDVRIARTGTDAMAVIGTPVADAEAYELRFELWDGEQLTFALPERVEVLYTFERRADQVFVTATEVPFLDLAQAD